MKYTLIVKPEAELDMLESAQWYESKQENLGSRFLELVDDKILLIIDNPLHYQIRYKITRLALVEHFPYAIHFMVEEAVIVVLAVLGTREDSNKREK